MHKNQIVILTVLFVLTMTSWVWAGCGSCPSKRAMCPIKRAPKSIVHLATNPNSPSSLGQSGSHQGASTKQSETKIQKELVTAMLKGDTYRAESLKRDLKNIQAGR